jgi:large subunit ribosomal protein L13
MRPTLTERYDLPDIPPLPDLLRGGEPPPGGLAAEGGKEPGNRYLVTSKTAARDTTANLRLVTRDLHSDVSAAGGTGQAARRPDEEGRPVRTYQPKPADIQRVWHVIDASDVVLGKLATQAAQLLRGKHKATFAPHIDTGDFVIIVNASKISLSGSKREQSQYFRHSGFPGGLRATSYGELLDTRPELLVEKSIRGMLPKNKLAAAQLRKLKVYAGPEHPHQAQQPQPFELIQVAQ